MELMFKFGTWKASIKSGKVPSAHLIKHKLFFLQCVNYIQRIVDDVSFMHVSFMHLSFIVKHFVLCVVKTK